MKPKKHLLKKITVIPVILLICMLIASGSGPESIISALVSQRTDIMNEYFCGQIIYKDAADRIARNLQEEGDDDNWMP